MTRDRIYVQHILDAIGLIKTYTSVGRAEFLAKTHWHDATIRQLEIIGEAVKNLSESIRNEHPDIPWRRIAGLRDVLIHNYMGVDLEAVWEVTQGHLPALENTAIRLLNSFESTE